MSHKSEAAAEILDHLSPTGNVTIIASTSATDTGGNEGDYWFSTWHIKAYIYDSSEAHPDANAQGMIKIGEATALIHPYGWDADSIAANLDEHSDWYSEIGRMLLQADRPGLEALYETHEDEILEEDASDIVIVPWLRIKKEWRGHRFSLEILNAIGKSFGRHCAFMVVIDPQAFTTGGPDEEGARKVVAFAESANFCRWYSTPLFIRSNLRAGEMESTAEDAAMIPIRHSWGYAGIVIAPHFDSMASEYQVAPVDLPETPRTAGHLYPAELGRFILTPPEPGIRPITITLALPEYGAYVSVSPGPDGRPVVGGHATAEIIETITPWATALFEDCVEFASAVESAVENVLNHWLEEVPLPAPEPGQQSYRVPWLPHANLPEWVDGGLPRMDVRAGARTTVTHNPMDSAPIVVGEFFIEEMATITAEIRPDLGWHDEDVAKAAEWMHIAGLHELSFALIAGAIMSGAYTHLAGPNA